MKSSKKKSDNLFTFKSFNQQLSQISIKLINKTDTLIYKNSNDEEEHLSSFYLTLEKFNNFNTTFDLMELKKSLGHLISVKTLPQILHQKEKIFKILIEHLNKKNNQALEVIIQLISSLATDIRTDFYLFFEETFLNLIKFLNSQDVSIIENIFYCFAYLFKILWKPMVKDIKKIFQLFSKHLFNYDQHEYNRIFAAQSFSFLIRKANSQKEIINLLLKTVSKNEAISFGISFLFFETVKGIKTQFHSCFFPFISSLLQQFVDDWNNDNTVKSCVHEAFHLIFSHTDKQNSRIVWTCLLDSAKSNFRFNNKLTSISKIILKMVEYKKCYLVDDCNLLINFVNDMLSQTTCSQNCLQIFFQISSFILVYMHQELSFQSIEVLIKNSFEMNFNYNISFKFAQSLFTYAFFERDVLIKLLTQCQKCLVDNSSQSFSDSISILYSLINCKRPLPLPNEKPSWHLYPLNFEKFSPNEFTIMEAILSVLKNYNDWESILKAVKILPHIRPLDTQKCGLAFIDLFYNIRSLINQDLDSKKIILLETILLEIIHSLIFLDFCSIFDQIKLEIFLDILKISPSHQAILQSFVYYLQYALKLNRKDIFDIHIFEEVYFNHLQDNLQHFNSNIRILTLLLVTLFDPPLPPTEDGSTVKSIFSICLEAELIPVTLNDYREKLRLLSLLEYGLINYAFPIATLSGYSYQHAPLNFFLGSLYNNFSLLWAPIQKLIESHVRGVKDFSKSWQIIFQHFNRTEELINSKINNTIILETNDPNLNDQNNLNYDHHNHRILLLNTFKLFVDIIEPRNADIVCWFLNFIDKETLDINLNRFKYTENITLDQKMDENVKNYDYENQDDCHNKDNKNQNKSIEKRKKIWKTLIAFLELFSSFRNPKAIYKEKQLQELYNLLLTSKNNHIQKLAFKCIMTYNFEFLAPYHNNVLRIIDDNTFKSEIVSFSLSSDSQKENNVDSNFRINLMPYLMRILYGKMLSKTGLQTAGKSKANLRRSIVLRFLAGCSHSELMLFVEFAFSNFFEYLKMHYQQIEKEFSQINLKQVISLKCVKSCLNTLEMMMNYLVNIANGLLPTIFKLTLILSMFITTLLSKRLLIKNVYISRLKTLRIECFKLTNLFFTDFNQYLFNSEEIDVLFKALISSRLINLENSSLQSPSPVLKFFLALSEYPRYFILFVKKVMIIGYNENTYPLLFIINLYSNDKADISIFSCISHILSNLLSLNSYQPMDIDSEHSVSSYLDVNDLIDNKYREYYLNQNDQVNFGKIILKPFISQILIRIRKNFEKRICIRRFKNKTPIITEKESIILFYISELIEEESDCIVLINLLIDSIDLKNNLLEESVNQTLKSVNNLIIRVKSNPRQHIIKLSRLFNTCTNRLTRLEIVDILETIALNDVSCLEISKLVKLINSYNKRNPEEPDFNVRNEGFCLCKKKIEIMSRENEFDIELIYLIIHNCCFFIRTIEDLGLRETSSEVLKLIIKRLSESNNETLFKRICFDLLYIGEVIKGLKHLNENVKHEFIVILANLIKYGKTKHSFFTQLSILSNEDDLDLDFWSNIKHIQVHRRVRALNRLARNYNALSQISPQILNHCFLTIASSFLFDKKYDKYPTAVTAGIELIGSICLFLNWKMYENLLKHYLKRLSKDQDNHKTIVRMISTILENFNFDLSNSDAIEKDAIYNNCNKMKNNPIKRQTFDSEISTKIHLSIVENVLPKLFEALHRLAYADFDHDLIKVEYQQEEEIKRIPISIAIVKLLLNIPILPSVFDINIRSVFLRLCHFLKSRTESIREVARSTLTKIMQCLGAKHLRSLLFELRSSLKKGYQLHVLTYSIHVVLENLVVSLENGDLDDSAEILIEICNQELFTDIAEEKEIGKIIAKSKEAKKLKSYEIYRLIGKFISENMIIKSVVPLKNIITETHEPKVIKKSSICLQNYFNGLTDNKQISIKCLLIFILNVVEDKIPELSVKKTKKASKTNNLRKDYRLLEPEPRIRTKPKTNPSSNIFIIFEYCFKLLLSLFKKNKIPTDSLEITNLLSKFVPLFKDSLKAQHLKLTTIALRSINYIIIKFKELLTFQDYCNAIKDDIMVLLHDYTGQGFASNDNFELISACFKTISLLIKEIKEIKVNQEQLRILLFHIDQNVNDNSKQSTAFFLLKSILSKKLSSPELPEIMKRLAILIIQTDEEFIRKEGRQIWLKYLLEHLEGKEFENYVMFFLKQISHERISGREWALKFIESVLNHFESHHFEFMGSNIFIHISSRLINDDSSSCRNLASSILKLLITKSSLDLKNLYFNDIIIPWFQSDNSLQRQLASQLCEIFAEAELDQFKSRFRFYIPLLEQQLDPDRYEKRDYNSEPTNDDFLINYLLKLFLKTFQVDPNLLSNKKWSEYIKPIWFYIEKSYLSYSNLWIRVLCLKLIGFLFSYYSIPSIVKAIIDPKENNEYFLHQTPNRIWSLCKQHLKMFNSVYEAEIIGELLVQNLLFIGRILNNLPKDLFLTNFHIESKLQNRLKLEWFFRRMVREINREIVKYPNHYKVRIVVFKWMTVMILEMNNEEVKVNLRTILVPLCREVAKKGVAEMIHIPENNPKYKLMTISFQLFELIRNKIESETFTSMYAQVLSFLNRKKSERKALKAIEFVTDPIKAVLRKQKKHMASRENRKRQMLEKKGKRVKKQRLS